MKRYLILLSIVLYFLLLLCFPAQSINGAAQGLQLWFQSVIPTLFPFAVLSSLLIRTQAMLLLNRCTSPFFTRLFHVSSQGSFAVLAGFCCGYPMGAKTTADLYRKGWISFSEASYLLSFCNNTSPMLIIGYVMLQSLQAKEHLLPSLLILLLSPVLCSFLFRRYHKPQLKSEVKKEARIRFSFSDVDHAILSGMETITKVGGYMILFSILLSYSALLPINGSLVHLGFIPSLEISGGIRYLIAHAPSLSVAYVPTMALTSFGGFCALFQTKAMLEGTDLSIYPYLIEKLITALVTSLFASCYQFYLI